MKSKTLDIYSIFHLNLGFSCIPSDQYAEIIERCYWPLLRWAEVGLGRFGIEFPAKTCEVIQRLDSKWIEKLLELERANKIEIVGSGLVQSIFPLIPAEVNAWNLKLGLEYYRTALGILPKTVYVHEQTYSRGLPELYYEAGFENLVFDWNNSISCADRPALRFKSPRVRTGEGAHLQIVWNKFVAFQRFQRYVHQDLDLNEYLDYLMQQYEIGAGGAFCIYGSDFEMLDYRPGNADVLYGVREKNVECQRVELLLNKIKTLDLFRWQLPHEVAKRHAVSEEIALETPAYPIPAKKQEKYNVTRWAVAGRENARLNTLCYKAYELLRSISDSLSEIERRNLWTQLCRAWSSDFRTYTTEEKYVKCHVLIGGLLSQLEALNCKPKDDERIPSASEIEPIGDNLVLRNSKIELEVSPKRGTIRKLRFLDISEKPLIGTIPQGTYDSITHAVDYFSGHTIAERPGTFRFTDLDNVKLLPSEGKSKLVFQHSSTYMTLWKTYSLTERDLGIDYHFQFKDFPAASLRFGILSAMPSSFDRSSLWYATHNGGKRLEQFDLSECAAFDAGEAVGAHVTSSFCLGATENQILFGDKSHGILVESRKSEQYSVPLVAYAPLHSTFLFRLTHSMGELDDTANTLWRGHVKVSLRIRGIGPQDKEWPKWERHARA